MKTIIEMAEDVGAYVADLPLEDAVLFEVDMSGRSAKLEAFAALVAAAEREACAKVAEEWQTEVDDPRYQKSCADAIRARGQA